MSNNAPTPTPTPAASAPSGGAPGAPPPMPMLPVFMRISPPVHGSHRGGRGPFAPENTLYAYRKAVNESLTAILEIDLHLTKDGAIVLCHDDDISITSNGRGLIRDMTLEALRSFDTAHHFSQDGGKTYPLRGQNITFPTLNEVLDEFLPKNHLVFFFDVKCLEVVEPMFQEIEKRKMQDRVILGALDYSINQKLLTLKPKEIPLTVDFKTMMDIHGALMRGQLATFPIEHEILGFVCDERTKQQLSPQVFHMLHARGKPIAVFGDMLNTEEGIRFLLKCRADIYFSDRPDVLKATFQKVSAELTQRMQQMRQRMQQQQQQQELIDQIMSNLPAGAERPSMVIPVYPNQVVSMPVFLPQDDGRTFGGAAMDPSNPFFGVDLTPPPGPPPQNFPHPPPDAPPGRGGKW